MFYLAFHHFHALKLYVLNQGLKTEFEVSLSDEKRLRTILMASHAIYSIER